MRARDFRPETKRIVAAITAVAATYAYFLLFAQFGFLKALQIAAAGKQGVMMPVLATMGGAGILGSVLAAFVFTMARARRWLIAGFVVCGGAAGLSLAGTSPGLSFAVAVLIGGGTALVTVTLAGLLWSVLGGWRVGTIIGLGTGLAYGFSSLPGIFDASPIVQAQLSLLVALIGAIAALGLVPGAVARDALDFDCSSPGIALWVLLFLLLVWLDSAAFYGFQRAPSFGGEMWAEKSQLALVAVAHLLAAVLAGVALDRGWLGRTVAVAAAVLVFACVTLANRWLGVANVASIYAAAVSIYSVALVFYAANSRSARVAATVYAAAGWGGSALGIGFAEGRLTVPGWIVAMVAILIAVGVAVRGVLRGRAKMGEGNQW
ncbi:MAG TPA: hypothetical protein VGM64_01575 [Lacunisphaera sp.]|jgi:cytochrome c oxidase cbb3-type subunit 2